MYYLSFDLRILMTFCFLLPSNFSCVSKAFFFVFCLYVVVFCCCFFFIFTNNTGADPGFQVRGGGAHLKYKKNLGHFVSEKSRFYAKKNIIFSNFWPPPLDPPLQ